MSDATSLNFHVPSSFNKTTFPSVVVASLWLNKKFEKTLTKVKV